MRYFTAIAIIIMVLSRIAAAQGWRRMPIGAEQCDDKGGTKVTAAGAGHAGGDAVYN
jgi:hypothetical protein